MDIIDKLAVIATHKRIHAVLSTSYPFTTRKPARDYQGTLILSAVRCSHNIPFPGAANYLNKIEEGRA